ncbi:unnamed protein product [Protopolystoma xenopodis]|uniref:Uncharacterized protein n=1 Tax=Protopolystoma xenopodis TaxID=117903 RepID=A0A3S5CTH5_9PLAT|nr:unnamed protein product [Protopolystoma xenopodis]
MFLYALVVMWWGFCWEDLSGHNRRQRVMDLEVGYKSEVSSFGIQPGCLKVNTVKQNTNRGNSSKPVSYSEKASVTLPDAVSVVSTDAIPTRSDHFATYRSRPETPAGVRAEKRRAELNFHLSKQDSMSFDKVNLSERQQRKAFTGTKSWTEPLLLRGRSGKREKEVGCNLKMKTQRRGSPSSLAERRAHFARLATPKLRIQVAMPPVPKGENYPD